MYGEDELYDGGLSIRTTLDTSMQLAARRALRNGLEAYDRRHGYRGPLATIELGDDWTEALSGVEVPRDLNEGWMPAVVLETTASAARIGFLNGEEGEIPMSALEWARETLPDGEIGPPVHRPSDVLGAGDVILVASIADQEGYTEGQYGLRQVPAINGGILAMDPHTGRVLAMVGGYSFQHSQFNRATQARRQPAPPSSPLFMPRHWTMATHRPA